MSKIIFLVALVVVVSSARATPFCAESSLITPDSVKEGGMVPILLSSPENSGKDVRLSLPGNAKIVSGDLHTNLSSQGLTAWVARAGAENMTLGVLVDDACTMRKDVEVIPAARLSVEALDVVLGNGTANILMDNFGSVPAENISVHLDSVGVKLGMSSVPVSLPSNSSANITLDLEAELPKGIVVGMVSFWDGLEMEGVLFNFTVTKIEPILEHSKQEIVGITEDKIVPENPAVSNPSETINHSINVIQSEENITEKTLSEEPEVEDDPFDFDEELEELGLLEYHPEENQAEPVTTPTGLAVKEKKSELTGGLVLLVIAGTLALRLYRRPLLRQCLPRLRRISCWARTRLRSIRIPRKSGSARSLRR